MSDHLVSDLVGNPEDRFSRATARMALAVEWDVRHKVIQMLFFFFRFIRSLSRCRTWEAKGGKSGSSFRKTIGKFCETLASGKHVRAMNTPLNPTFI